MKLTCKNFQTTFKDNQYIAIGILEGCENKINLYWLNSTDPSDIDRIEIIGAYKNIEDYVCEWATKLNAQIADSFITLTR